MFPIVIAIAMAVFATVTSAVSRRTGSGINRRPYGNIYSDASGARRSPSGD